VQRFGFHAQPTFLVIAFNSALDPVPATKISNYLITGPNGGRIKVSSATYNATTHTVTLRPAQLLNISKTYRLTINGTAPSGLTNSAGVLLDGAGTGQPGSNFVTSITSSNLAGSASQRPIAAIAKARAKTFVVRAKFSIHKHAK
jgi:Bacterial Ig-like domain